MQIKITFKLNNIHKQKQSEVTLLEQRLIDGGDI